MWDIKVNNQLYVFYLKNVLTKDILYLYNSFVMMSMTLQHTTASQRG